MVFQSVYVFIPQFLAKPLMMFCGTLIIKHSCGVLPFYIPCLMFISPYIEQQFSDLYTVGAKKIYTHFKDVIYVLCVHIFFGTHCISNIYLCITYHILSIALTWFCVHWHYLQWTPFYSMFSETHQMFTSFVDRPLWDPFFQTEARWSYN